VRDWCPRLKPRSGVRKSRVRLPNFERTTGDIIESQNMGISTHIAQTTLLLSIATLTCAAENRDWNQGRLVSVETITSDKGERRYECVVSDITWSYTVQYEHPIKAPVHRPIKFVIEKDTLILLDADDKEQRARIKKRERVFVDSPGLHR
jgi:hypothetical protein